MNFPNWSNKNLILVMGKGGVGKTAVAKQVALHLAAQGKRTLLCHVLQINNTEQKLEKTSENLSEITLRASDCFREYIILKLKVRALYTAFLGNSVTQYFERAAPGVREMVLLGKIWFERENYDHVVVDMPSTGYALAMINTPFNYAALFPGGPIYRDSQDMIATFRDPQKCAFVTVSLAEEMPIQESLELAQNLQTLLPNNHSELIINRVLHVSEEARAIFEKHKSTSDENQNPLWKGLSHLVQREHKQRSLLNELLPVWKKYSTQWSEIAEGEIHA